MNRGYKIKEFRQEGVGVRLRRKADRKEQG
jgi:hypothetical protein